MLIVDPAERLSCKEILQLKQVQKYLPEQMKQQVQHSLTQQTTKANMLRTIRIQPGQLQSIKSKLPKPNYDRTAMSSRQSQSTTGETRMIQRNQSLPAVPFNQRDAAPNHYLNKLEEQKEDARSYLERYGHSESKKHNRALSRHDIGQIPTQQVKAGDQVSQVALSARYKRGVNQSANQSKGPQMPLKERALEYNLRHNPPTPRHPSEKGGSHLPPIDSKHLRKVGEAILNKDLSKNGEAIMSGGGRSHNGSQATLKQRLNSRASSGNRAYGRMEAGSNVENYQRRYGIENGHGQPCPLPPRPNQPRYHSIQQAGPPDR